MGFMAHGKEENSFLFGFVTYFAVVENQLASLETSAKIQKREVLWKSKSND